MKIVLSICSSLSSTTIDLAAEIADLKEEIKLNLKNLKVIKNRPGYAKAQSKIEQRIARLKHQLQEHSTELAELRLSH